MNEGRFSCTCPECGVTNKDDDYTDSLLKIPHKENCMFLKGIKTKFKIVDTLAQS